METNGKRTGDRTSCFSHQGKKKNQNEKGGQQWICYPVLALRDILAADKLDQ